MSLPSPSSWTLAGAGGLPILGNTHAPSPAAKPRGTVLIGHGFKGYKDYGLLPRLADAVAAAGWTAARFNFSHSGMTEPEGPFSRPDLFALDTWNKQVHDWHALADAARADGLGGPPAAGPVVFFGHSRGGLSALLAAARATAGARPAAVIAAAAPADAHRLGEADAAALRAGQAVDSPSGRTGQTLRVMPGWLLEQDADPANHDPVRAAAALGEAGVPLLLVHGDQDATVAPADASRLAEAAAAGTRPVLVAGGDHVFGAPNPMPAGAEVPGATAALFEAVCGFLDTLGESR